MAKVDLSAKVGSLNLPYPVLTASGTAGYGDELAGYIDFQKIGAHVCKSVRSEPWDGNAAPRVHPMAAGMMNSVGLPGPGVDGWNLDYLPGIRKLTDRIVVSIWDFTFDGYEKCAQALSDAPEEVIAVEVNVSCPNTEEDGKMFAQSAKSTKELVERCLPANRPLWAKLTPAVSNIVEIAEAAYEGGAEAVVLTNTMPGMVIDIDKCDYVLGAGPKGGGLSGLQVHPIVVRAVHDVKKAFPEKSIVAVGGVTTGREAIEFFMAGANAVEVGTATFEEPTAIHRITNEMETWCKDNSVASVASLVGAIHNK